MMQVLLLLSENNDERNRVDPKVQLAALYLEIKEMMNLISAMERRLDGIAHMTEDCRVEVDRLILDKPGWASDIAEARERIIRQRGLSLKDMLSIQQEVVKLEENMRQADLRIEELQQQREQYEENRQQLTARLRRQKAQYNQHAGVYNQEKAKADALMAEFAAKEDALLASLEPDDRSLFREALRSNPDNPVVILDGDICSGCRISLSTQLVKHVNRGNRLINCENCLRVLLPSSALNDQ